MTRQGIVYLLLTVLLVSYLLIATGASRSMAYAAPCCGVDIRVRDNAMSPFVTPDDIDHELGGMRAAGDSLSMGEFNLLNIEKRLTALPNIEKVNCLRLNNDRLLIDVEPMVPVARVYDSGKVYYISESGKKLTASKRYRIDVPIIVGRFDSVNSPVTVVPLIKAVEASEERKSIVDYYQVNSKGDIFIVPRLTGHLINFGDTTAIDSKFERLSRFYTKVMPVKGWDYYNVINLKYAGQVIAEIAPNRQKSDFVPYTEEDFEVETPIDNAEAAEIDTSTIKPTIN